MNKLNQALFDNLKNYGEAPEEEVSHDVHQGDDDHDDDADEEVPGKEEGDDGYTEGGEKEISDYNFLLL